MTGMYVTKAISVKYKIKKHVSTCGNLKGNDFKYSIFYYVEYNLIFTY